MRSAFGQLTKGEASCFRTMNYRSSGALVMVSESQVIVYLHNYVA